MPASPMPSSPARSNNNSPSPYANSPQGSTTHLLPPPATGGKSNNRGPASKSTGSRFAPAALGPGSGPSYQQVDGYATIASNRGSSNTSISDKFSLAADPNEWDAELNPNVVEPDDYLHNPDPKRDYKNDTGGTIFTSRGFANLGCMFIMSIGLIMLFAGYPILSYFTKEEMTTLGGYNLGGINATGQVPDMPGNFALIDKDTPPEALTKISYTDGEEWELVFSDEFNVDGRSFYPGDDPYWEAENLHYWGTNNMEWYDPEAVTTQDGNLVITLDRKMSHNLNYEGGLVTSWNKFCFTGGLIEVSAVLPGASDIYGLWPAVWTLGNLGRAGYGGSLDGMWPYTYDSCDVGTLPNQTRPDGTPVENTQGNDPGAGGALSYLPGQKLSACTCDGEIHPGPRKPDGSFVGRAAPEIDILEAQVDSGTRIGHVSQSGQWAPFNYKYEWLNTSENFEIYDHDVAELNSYKGGALQQSTSVLALTNQQCYQHSGGCYSVYGFEYKPGNDGWITWISDGKKTWHMKAAGMGPDAISGASQRPVPQEPMYIIANLGMSRNFGPVEEEAIVFPTKFLIDYVRVYQPKDAINIGCSPPDFPTEEYIQTFIEAYTDPNITTWKQYGQAWPKNRLIDTC
ncbi:hypothetical protein FRC03_006878 [Tulasnella sp. 419]|nr:hypothetical protein FRC03_006878 [Tulasnella sp. 419]